MLRSCKGKTEAEVRAEREEEETLRRAVADMVVRAESYLSCHKPIMRLSFSQTHLVGSGCFLVYCGVHFCNIDFGGLKSNDQTGSKTGFGGDGAFSLCLHMPRPRLPCAYVAADKPGRPTGVRSGQHGRVWAVWGLNRPFLAVRITQFALLVSL